MWQPKIPAYTSTVPFTDNLGPVERSDFPNTYLIPTVLQVGNTDSALVNLDGARNANRTFSRAIADKGLGLPDLVNAVTAAADPTPMQQVRTRGQETGEPRNGMVITQHLDMRWKKEDPYKYLFGQWEIVGDPGLFCQKGESGALVLDAYTPTAVGLLHCTNQPPKSPSDAPVGKFGYLTGNTVQTVLRTSVVW